MASQWIGRGLFWQASLLTLVVGVLSVICNFALIPVFGMYGAVTTMLLTYGVSVVGNGMMALWIEWVWRKSQAVIV
jgi:O-antigen/teichoic acid export membrane protein